MKYTRLIIMVLVFALCLPLAACVESEQKVNGNALLQVILEQVTFDTPIADVGENSSYYFSNLPAGATVKMYTGSGYYADRVALITVSNPDDLQKVNDSVEEHIAQLRHQFANYIPEEVNKIDHAVIWSQDVYVLMCVAKDFDLAKKIVNDAYAYTKDIVVTDDSKPSQTPDATSPSGSDTVHTTEPVQVEFETITSKSGSYRRMGQTYIVDDAAYEYYSYDDSLAADYTHLVNQIAADLEGKVDVYALPIPTAMGVVFPDDMAEALGDKYYNQNVAIESIIDKFSANVTGINCWTNLMQHRTEYLYFKTDFHWNGKAAYYAYESWCKTLGYTPYTLEERKLWKFDGFWGGLYLGDCERDRALSEDTVEAYHPYSQNIDMVITDKNGKSFSWNVISDTTNYSAGVKYSTFGGADNPLTVYKNPNVTDGSVGVVVKESFGNALMPYMVDHYSILYEIDYRYWDGNIAQFCLDVGADELTMANNLGMIRAAVLIAMLADNV